METKAKVIITTTDSEEVAEKICVKLVSEGLAACVQQMPIKSMYKWKGEVQCDDEIILLIKTSVAVSENAIKAIKETHTYDLPEIIEIPVTGGLPGYLEWINSETIAGMT